jgi:hypothetical protein
MVDFWTRLKNHLNDSIDIEAKSRATLIDELRPLGSAFTTFDTYMNYLHKADYLLKPRRGWYKLADDMIPIDLSISDVKVQAYGINHDRDYDAVNSDYDIGWDLSDELREEPSQMIVRKMKVRKKPEFFKKEEFAL